MIPIRFQKILRFIPVINFITLFCWIYTCWQNNVKSTEFLKKWIKVLVFNFLIVIPRLVLSESTTTIWADIACMAFNYLHLFSVSYVAVKAQEEIFSKNQTSDY